MANQIKLKRRLTGTAGAPTALANGEIAFNEVDDTLYYGKGDAGGGAANSIVPIAGSGKFVTTDSEQTISGVKTFSSPPKAPTPVVAGDVANKAYVDAQSGGEAATAVKLKTARTIALTGDATGSALFDGSANASITVVVTDNSHDHTIANVTGLQTALDAKAPLAGPTFTGVPKAPTAATSANTTQIATTAFVQAALAALVDSSPEALDTLNELAAALGDDPNFAATMTAALAGKQPLDPTLTALAGTTVAANQIIYSTGADAFATTALSAFARTLLDDATNTAMRTTLGLGTLSTQAANAVAITGGSISNVTTDGLVIDGGTF